MQRPLATGPMPVAQNNRFPAPGVRTARKSERSELT